MINNLTDYLYILNEKFPITMEINEFKEIIWLVAVEQVVSRFNTFSLCLKCHLNSQGCKKMQKKIDLI